MTNGFAYDEKRDLVIALCCKHQRDEYLDRRPLPGLGETDLPCQDCIYGLGTTDIIALLRTGARITFNDETYLAGLPAADSVEAGTKRGSLGSWELEQPGYLRALAALGEERDRRIRERLGDPFSPRRHVTLCADSVEQLRASDVYRLLDEAPEGERATVVNYVKGHRADLAELTDKIFLEEFAGR